MLAECTPCRVYHYRGTLVVPHYTKRATFVAPGGLEVPLSRLEAVNAPAASAALWVRHWAVKANMQRAGSST